MAATETKKAIAKIEAELAGIKARIADGTGVPTDAPLTFSRIAASAVLGGAASVNEVGEA